LIPVGFQIAGVVSAAELDDCNGLIFAGVAGKIVNLG
jgi:hypothetical protein